MVVRLTDDQYALMRALALNPGASNAELIRRSGLPERTAQGVLRALRIGALIGKDNLPTDSGRRLLEAHERDDTLPPEPREHTPKPSKKTKHIRQSTTTKQTVADRIVNLLVARGPMGVDDVRDALGLTIDHARVTLNELSRSGEISKLDRGGPYGPPDGSAPPPEIRAGTKRGALLDAIEDHPDGLTSSEITSALGARFPGHTSKQTSAMLSTMVRLGLVHKRGRGLYAPISACPDPLPPEPSAPTPTIPEPVIEQDGRSATPPWYRGEREMIDTIRDILGDRFPWYVLGQIRRYERVKDGKVDEGKRSWHVQMLYHLAGIGPDPRCEIEDFRPYFPQAYGGRLAPHDSTAAQARVAIEVGLRAGLIKAI